MIGLVGHVGRVGAVGGARSASPSMPAGVPDFALSANGVATAWDLATVGLLVPLNAPAGAFFMLVEGTAARGDDAGLAVVNG